MDDDDEYECQILGTRSPPVRLAVLRPPDPPYIEGGGVREVIEHRTVELKCVSRGAKPAPRVNWFDAGQRLMNSVRYESVQMADSRLFEASSVLSLRPTRNMHNATFSCEAWNSVSEKMGLVIPAAVTRLEVKYSPDVQVVAVRQGVPKEGEKAGYQCLASANPAPFPDRFRWYIDDRPIRGQFGFYYEIRNVTRILKSRRLKCSVENELGIASAGISLDVHCESRLSLRLIEPP